MAEVDEQKLLLKQAAIAVQTGQLDRAQRILAGLLRQDPENAEAWVWLGKAVDDPKRRQDCFQRALRLDPNNDQARAGLVALRSGPSLEEVTEGAAPKRISAYPYPCAQCGAHARYDVSAGALRCPHCGTQHSLPEVSAPPAKLPVPQDLSLPDAQVEPIGQQLLHCRFCGATTVFSVRTAALSCPFCGAPQAVQKQRGSPLIPPQAVVPFGLDQPDAEQALREWLGRGWFRPGDLAGRAELNEVHGAYLPFWLFSGLAKVSYRLDSSGYSPSAMVPGNVEQHIPLEDMLVPAAYSLDQDTLRAIEPFDLEKAQPFRPEYLAGWPAEVYQLALADATIQAREHMSKEAQLKADAWTPPPVTYMDPRLPSTGYGAGQRQRQAAYKAHFWAVQLDSFQHLLLPVWLGSYRYRGELFSFAINGQTGKVGGEAPRSNSILALTAAVAVALLGLVAVAVLRFWPAIQGTGGEGAAQPLEDVVDPLTFRLAVFALLIVGPLLIGLVVRFLPQIQSWFQSLRSSADG